MTKYEIKKANGEIVVRRSEANYSHASERDGIVRFHMSERAARSAAGRFGIVHRIASDEAPAAAPEKEVWRVEFDDGSCRDYAVDMPPQAIRAAREDRPDRSPVRASRVRS